jgi:hypothetical protein
LISPSVFAIEKKERREGKKTHVVAASVLPWGVLFAFRVKAQWEKKGKGDDYDRLS